MSGKEDVFPRLEEAARLCIEEDGADVLCLGSTTMHQAHAYLTDRLDVPVINPGPLTYKIVEALLGLGLSHSRQSLQRPDHPRGRRPSVRWSARVQGLRRLLRHYRLHFVRVAPT